MNPSTLEPSSLWRRATARYAQAISDYIARGNACQWKNMGEPDKPPALARLLPELIRRIRAANATGDEADVDRLRADWPPMHDVMGPLRENNEQGFAAIAWLPAPASEVPDLLVRTGTWYEPGHTWCIQGLRATPLPDIDMFGASPDRQVLAWVSGGRIHVGPAADWRTVWAEFPIPTGAEELPPSIPPPAVDNPAPTAIQQLIPFNDASRVVVVQSAGVFLVTPGRVRRLLPIAREYLQSQGDEEPSPIRLDMVHAAVSPDGRWIACGAQDGLHPIFDAEGQLVDQIESHSEYPHHAAFFADGRHLALNACHFYHGCTIVVDTARLGSLVVAPGQEDPRVTIIDESARVYASAPVGDALVLGDAYGYLWVREPQGQLQWTQHLGGTLCAMAATADGRWLAVASYSGTLHIIDLKDAQAAPEQIGQRPRKERRRWLFWQREVRPLAW